MSTLRVMNWGRVAGSCAILCAGTLALSCAEEELRQAHQALQGPTTGAIFTTFADGSSVNNNIYEAKEDVYLDGGPGINAPISAAGLPPGDYYFQVTDPSGKDLLSSDHISCRQVTVNDDGVLSMGHPGTTYSWQKNQLTAHECLHLTGIDVDHNAITVQLMPYDDTPNRGGVYKVWMTPTDEYLGDPNFIPNSKKDAVNGEAWEPGNAHGFNPRFSKTDNYKVKKRGKDRPPSVILLEKFHDHNMNGFFDEGDMMVTGWPVSVLDPLGGSNTIYTPELMLVSTGEWLLTEATPSAVMQTVAFKDGVVDSMMPTASPLVTVQIMSDVEEMHHVFYGNVGLGDVSACKVFDKNGNGVADEGEPTVAGWPMTLTGTTILGETVGPIALVTDDSGCVSFAGLIPGEYMVSEGSGGGTWVPTGEVTLSTTIESQLNGAVISGSSADFTFTNVCTLSADFGTKGYWHNKNGLAEITPQAIDLVNTLPPYASPSSYFDAGDEAFDGLFEDGTPVAAARGPSGDTIASAGTALAEISQFLIDPNEGGDPREQLAQQLLAFTMNSLHRLDGLGTAIFVDGEFVTAGELIDMAIAAWEGSDPMMQNSIKNVLDALNNSDDVAYIPESPCPVVGATL